MEKRYCIRIAEFTKQYKKEALRLMENLGDHGSSNFARGLDSKFLYHHVDGEVFGANALDYELIKPIDMDQLRDLSSGEATDLPEYQWFAGGLLIKDGTLFDDIRFCRVNDCIILSGNRETKASPIDSCRILYKEEI